MGTRYINKFIIESIIFYIMACFLWLCPNKRCLKNVGKTKIDKLEAKSKVCQFKGYLKGTKGYYFYSQVDQ